MTEIEDLTAGMTDEELLEAVEEKYAGYTRAALDAALRELARRGLSFRDMSADYPPADEDDCLREKGTMAPDVASCPQCGGALPPGAFRLHAGGFVEYCLFAPADGGEEIRVLKPYEERPAYRCDACKLVVVKTRQ